MSGPRERWPPGSAALVDIGAAEGIQVAVGVDPDSVGRQVGDGDSQTSLDLCGGRDARRVKCPTPWSDLGGEQDAADVGSASVDSISGFAGKDRQEGASFA